MSFKQFGGLNYAAKNNIIGNLYSTSVNSGTTNVIGQENSKIVCLSHLDMSANSIMHVGSLYFMDGTVQDTAYESSSGVPVFNTGIIVNNGSQLNGGVHVAGGLTTDSLTISSGGTQNSILYKNGSGVTNFFDFGVGQATQTLSVNSGGNLEWTNSSNPGNGALSLTCSHSTSITGTFTANQTAGSTIAITLDATDANTPSTIVARDGSGNFSAGTITASLSGNATTATTATNLANGASYSIPCQTASGTTGYIANGTTGYVLTCNSLNIPSWQPVSASSTTITTTNNNTSTTLYPVMTSAASTGQTPYVDTTGLSYNASTKLLTIDNLTVNGTCTATSFTSSSDYRIKEDVVTLNNKFNVDKLRPVTYKNKNTQKQDIGFIAHEVQEEFPYLVSGEKNGEQMQSLNYIGLIGVLVKEIQELKKRVHILENK